MLGKKAKAKKKSAIDSELRCSYCFHSVSQCRALFQSPDHKAYICGECVVICVALLDERCGRPVNPAPPAEEK